MNVQLQSLTPSEARSSRSLVFFFSFSGRIRGAFVQKISNYDADSVGLLLVDGELSKLRHDSSVVLLFPRPSVSVLIGFASFTMDRSVLRRTVDASNNQSGRT